MTTPPIFPPELLPALLASFERHRAGGHVTAQEYKSAKRYQLGQIVMEKERIYLDTNFWIGLRDVKLGKDCDPRYSTLLGLLLSLVESERAVVPLTNHLADEIFRQKDKQTRATTRVVVAGD
ncbi:MAG: hypothetical protein IH936_12830 [Acidobacteria bacterium]|nr:hypothetical protein [Acidobacteriota bacterium]